MHPDDHYERQHTRSKHRHEWRKESATFARCDCGAVSSVIDFALMQQADAIDNWNRAMRGNAKARRKYILTGRI